MTFDSKKSSKKSLDSSYKVSHKQYCKAPHKMQVPELLFIFLLFPLNLFLFLFPNTAECRHMDTADTWTVDTVYTWTVDTVDTWTVQTPGHCRHLNMQTPGHCRHLDTADIWTLLTADTLTLQTSMDTADIRTPQTPGHRGGGSTVHFYYVHFPDFAVK